MKQKSASQSAFFSLRVLIAFTAALVGVSAALLATAKQQRGGRPGFRQAAGALGQAANRAADSRQWFWQNPLPQGNDLRGASFIDTNTASLVGALRTIVRTTDGGNSWTIQTSGTTQNLWAVSFAGVNNGTVVGEGGTI